MRDLIDYVTAHSKRGTCMCGRCIDAVKNPEQQQPEGHSADLVFFKVSKDDDATQQELERLVRKNRSGEFASVDPFDGEEHSYIEIGAWIGDQGLAMQLMGLGFLLGSWKLLTPKTVFGDILDENMVQQMAGMGMVSIKASSKPKEKSQNEG